MKKWMILVMIAGLTAMGCANTSRYNTQRGAAIGAGLGALAGQAIGNDTKSTLIGTGVGTLLGSIVGNGIDQREDEYRHAQGEYQRGDDAYTGQYYGQYTGNENLSDRQPPPGRWIVIPGHWEGRHWVPPHEVWQPIDPR